VFAKERLEKSSQLSAGPALYFNKNISERE
jgi:hypothetical protein